MSLQFHLKVADYGWLFSYLHLLSARLNSSTEVNVVSFPPCLCKASESGSEMSQKTRMNDFLAKCNSNEVVIQRDISLKRLMVSTVAT